MGKIPFRQIHLDFHHSDKILDIGIDFENEYIRTVVPAVNGHEMVVFESLNRHL